MPVSGLVITLARRDTSPDIGGGLRDNAAQVIEQIKQHPHMQLGPQQGQRLPVVLDTPDRETDKACWGWLNSLAGVHHVDVAFIHFEDADAPEHAPCQSHSDQLIQMPTLGET
jgi:hypothetical protein